MWSAREIFRWKKLKLYFHLHVARLESSRWCALSPIPDSLYKFTQLWIERKSMSPLYLFASKTLNSKHIHANLCDLWRQLCITVKIQIKSKIIWCSRPTNSNTFQRPRDTIDTNLRYFALWTPRGSRTSLRGPWRKSGTLVETNNHHQQRPWLFATIQLFC